MVIHLIFGGMAELLLGFFKSGVDANDIAVAFQHTPSIRLSTAVEGKAVSPLTARRRDCSRALMVLVSSMFISSYSYQWYC